jgi:hypothetical protein
MKDLRIIVKKKLKMRSKKEEMDVHMSDAEDR